MIKQLIKNFQTRDFKPAKHQNLVEAQPFLQWVGGKRVLLSEYNSHFPEEFNDYWEPFLGGGAVFYHMFKKNPDKNYNLSDLNEELIVTYKAVRDNPVEVVSIIGDMNAVHSKEFYYAVRDINKKSVGKKFIKDFELKDKLTAEEMAARFIYLNKTCFNSLWRVNSQGLNNVPIGTSLKKDISDNGNIDLCSKALSKNVFLEYRNYKDILSLVKEGDFVYLDPPYHVDSTVSSFTAYNKSGFSISDQRDLKDFCDSLNNNGIKFMLSNSNSQLIRDLYSSYKQYCFSVARSLNSNKNKRSKESAGFNEILIKNY